MQENGTPVGNLREFSLEDALTSVCLAFFELHVGEAKAREQFELIWPTVRQAAHGGAALLRQIGFIVEGK